MGIYPCFCFNTSINCFQKRVQKFNIHMLPSFNYYTLAETASCISGTKFIFLPSEWTFLYCQVNCYISQFCLDGDHNTGKINC